MGLNPDRCLVADSAGLRVVHVGQVKGVRGHFFTIELIQVRVVVLGELPKNVVGDLHFPTDTNGIKFPYLLASLTSA